MTAAVASACFGESDRDADPGSRPESSLIAVPEDTSKIARRGGVYKGHNNSDIPTFDPHTASPPSWQAVQMGYSRLTQIEPGYLQPPSGEVIGDLAESWELSPDKLQLTFRLRPDALIAPVPPVGARAIDAHDVIYSWQRYAEIATNRALLANAIDPSSPVVTAQSTDARTVVFKLSAPSAALLAGFANVGSGNLYIVRRRPSRASTRVERRSAPGLSTSRSTTHPSVLSTGETQAITTRNVPTSRPWISGSSRSMRRPYHSSRPERSIHIKSAWRTSSLSRPTRPSWCCSRSESALIPCARSSAGRVRTLRRLSGTSECGRRSRCPGTVTCGSTPSTASTSFGPQEFRSKQAGTARCRRTATRTGGSTPKAKTSGPTRGSTSTTRLRRRRLLAAAGHAEGLDTDSYHIQTSEYGVDFPRKVEALLGFTREIGLRVRTVPLSFAAWQSTYLGGNGDFEGVSWGVRGGTNPVDPGERLYAFFNAQGPLFGGFDPQGSGTFAGDPTMDNLTTKMRTEFDNERRIELAREVQRLNGRKQYAMLGPGGASAFTIAWPIVSNSGVYRRDAPASELANPTSAVSI